LEDLHRFRASVEAKLREEQYQLGFVPRTMADRILSDDSAYSRLSDFDRIMVSYASYMSIKIEIEGKMIRLPAVCKD
jgi:hypothetical protein